MALFSFNSSSIKAPSVEAKNGKIQSSKALWETNDSKVSQHSTLDLDYVPVPLGGRLQGQIVLPPVSKSLPPFYLVFSCINQIPAVNGMSPVELVLNQEKKTVMAANGIVPIIFDVPLTAEETKAINSRERIFWRLEVTGNLPIIPFIENYEVPIIAGSILSSEQAEFVAKSTAELKENIQNFRPSSESGISVTATENGNIDFLFGSRRAIAPALFLLYIPIVMCGSAAVISNDFLFFGLITIALIILGCGIFAIFGTTRVSIGSGMMEIRYGLFGFTTSTISIPADDVVQIKPKIAFRMMGLGRGGKGPRLYYSIIVHCLDGNAIAGSMLTDHLEAEYLSAQMTARLKNI